MRPRVYISGPISGGPAIQAPHAVQLENAKRAVAVGQYLLEEGFAPLVPHLTVWWDELHPGNSWDAWLELDRPWVAVAEFVYRMPGVSAGADLEVAWAAELGVPVFEGTPTGFVEWARAHYEPATVEATRLVQGARQGSYGHPLDDFSRTAFMWQAILGVEVSAEQVGLCMAAVKISREVNQHKRDNLVDLAGYAETVALIHEERKRRALRDPSSQA